MKALPNLITFAGLAVGLEGVRLLPTLPGLALLGVSLLFDAVDGQVARRWSLETAFGSWFDWSVDVALAHAIAWRALPTFAPLISCGLAFLQADGLRVRMPGGRRRPSGRVAVTALTVALALLS